MMRSRLWNLGDYLETIRIRPSGKDSDAEECVLPGNNHPEVMNWASNSRIEFVQLFVMLEAAAQNRELPAKQGGRDRKEPE